MDVTAASPFLTITLSSHWCVHHCSDLPVRVLPLVVWWLVRTFIKNWTLHFDNTHWTHTLDTHFNDIAALLASKIKSQKMITGPPSPP